MDKKEKKVILIGGPTGSGKTDIALKLAEKYNGELINADSRQIYKYLDIGTNKGEVKDTGKVLTLKGIGLELPNPFDDDVDGHLPVFELNNKLIYMVSFMDPNKRFDVYRFKKVAYFLIEEILKKGKLPIVVGGTGLYIDAILKNYSHADVDEYQDIKLRNYLNSLDVGILQEMLATESLEVFNSLNESDKNNPRRLARILEKLKYLEAKENKKQISREDLDKKRKAPYDFTFLYPEYNWEDLRIKIEKRAEEMFKDGLVSETKKVLDMGFEKSSVALQGVGYKQVIEYIEGKYSLETCVDKVKNAHKHYARRQKTWFEGKKRGYDLIVTNSGNIVL